MPHFLSKLNQTVGITADIFTTPIRPVVRFIILNFNRQIDLLTYCLLVSLSFLKIIKLATKPSSDLDTDRAKCMWQAANERKILVKEVWFLAKPLNIFLAKLPNGKRLVFEGLPRPGGDSPNLEWMDNKGVMKIKFRRAGFPVPRGDSCFTLSKGMKIFREIRKNGGMTVVKPTLGSRSRHTRIHIKTEDEFITAFKIAKQIGPVVSVEEELRGTVFRVVLIGGKLAGVLRRDPPFVVGDGQKSVRNLVIETNSDERRQSHVFHAIPFNEEMDAALQIQNINRDSVPRFGEKIIVGTKIGRSQGGTNVDVTDEVHLENKKLFLDIAKYLKDPLIGLDFIIEDIKKPWRGQMPCGTIEINTIPFLDLHMYPFSGTPRDLSGMLWDEALRTA